MLDVLATSLKALSCLLPARPLSQCVRPDKSAKADKAWIFAVNPKSQTHRAFQFACVLACADRGRRVPAGRGADRGRAEPANAGVRAHLAGRGRRLRQPGARTLHTGLGLRCWVRV